MRRTTDGLGVGSFLLMVVAGCGAGEPETGVTVSDSAGVSVVESREARWGDEPRWVVETTPVLDLAAAGSGPGHEFFRVRDATRLAEGGVAVVNDGSAEVRFYASSGGFEGSVGRKGEGPGEFQRPISVDRYRGDSLVVFDYWSRRFTVLDTVRRVARMVTLAPPFTHELHAFPDGRFLLSVNLLTVRDTMVGRVRVPQALFVTTPGGTLGDTLAVVPGLEEFVFDEGSGLPPLVRMGSVAVKGDQVIVSDGEGVAFRSYSMDGVLERVSRIAGYPLGVPPNVRDSIRTALLGSQGPDFIRAASRAMAEEIPETYPGVHDLLVDNEGFVWAAAYHGRRVTGEPRRWLVFDPEGVWLGTVVMPADFDAYEIGTDYVLGRRRDHLDVETVQLLRLVRR